MTRTIRIEMPPCDVFPMGHIHEVPAPFTCRECGAIETDENPVCRESEVCSACHRESGEDYCPASLLAQFRAGHPKREFE